MKPSLNVLLSGLAAALFSAGGVAQANPGNSMEIAAPGNPACVRARDPVRCEALQKAKEYCKDKPTAETYKCMVESMPPMDCSKARNPERCTALQRARAACKDKTGHEYRQCVREHAPRRKGSGAAKG